jgi:beta-lactamase class A
MRIVGFAAVVIMLCNMTTFGAADPNLQRVLDGAVQATFKKFPDLKTNEMAATLIDLRDAEKPLTARFRGDERIYPASVIKLFYLVAIHQWMEDGKATDTPELRRAMKDMIVESLNEATGLVVDTLTGTTSGPEMPEAELKVWWEKRNAVNHYFTSLGYTNINASKKPWCEGPYGREMQATKAYEPRRNALTTDATARLMSEIVLHKVVTPARCDQMLELLHRDPFSKSGSSDGQGQGFTGMALPRGSQLWSKAGWTSETRHDCAYVELPNGAKFVLTVFTVGHANEKEIIPFLARTVISSFETK